MNVQSPYLANLSAPPITPSFVATSSANRLNATQIAMVNTDYHLNNIYLNTGRDFVHGNSYGLGGYQSQVFRRVGSNTYLPVPANSSQSSKPTIEGMMSFSGTINNCGRNTQYDEGVT